MDKGGYWMVQNTAKGEEEKEQEEGVKSNLEELFNKKIFAKLFYQDTGNHMQCGCQYAQRMVVLLLQKKHLRMRRRFLKNFLVQSGLTLGSAMGNST